jgi:hypothetical protein
MPKNHKLITALQETAQRFALPALGRTWTLLENSINSKPACPWRLPKGKMPNAKRSTLPVLSLSKDRMHALLGAF